MMRDFVARQQKAETYEAFLRQKVATACVSMQAGHGLTNPEVEGGFAAHRAGSV